MITQEQNFGATTIWTCNIDFWNNCAKNKKISNVRAKD